MLSINVLRSVRGSKRSDNMVNNILRRLLLVFWIWGYVVFVLYVFNMLYLKSCCGYVKYDGASDLVDIDCTCYFAFVVLKELGSYVDDSVQPMSAWSAFGVILRRQTFGKCCS